MSQQLCQEIEDGLTGGDPVGFLEANVVMINFGQMLDIPDQAIRTFDAVELTNLALQESDGTAINNGKIYDLDFDQAGHLQAHFLPWAEDRGYYILLDANSGIPLMFTATMSGCAAGYVLAPDGTARFSHHNIQGGNTTDEAAQQRSLSFAAGHALHRSRYRTSGGDGSRTFQGLAHVHGVLTNTGWKFYAQTIQHHRLTQGGQEIRIIEAFEL